MRMQVLAAITVLALWGCAAGTSGSPGFDANRISRTEIEEAGPTSAYDLIQRVRPLWLRNRGATSFTQETDVIVYVDGTRAGGRDELRRILSDRIESLEYYDARRATSRFGPGHVDGAILVTMRS
jgi:hypothetical protein